MIELTSLLHREVLKDIMLRWMSNNLQQEDCATVKRIVNFNVYILNLYLDRFCKDFFSFVSGEEAWTFEVNSKGELKDFVLDAAPYTFSGEHILRRQQGASNLPWSLQNQEIPQGGGKSVAANG